MDTSTCHHSHFHRYLPIATRAYVVAVVVASVLLFYHLLLRPAVAFDFTIPPNPYDCVCNNLCLAAPRPHTHVIAFSQTEFVVQQGIPTELTVTLTGMPTGNAGSGSCGFLTDEPSMSLLGYESLPVSDGWTQPNHIAPVDGVLTIHGFKVVQHNPFGCRCSPYRAPAFDDDMLIGDHFGSPDILAQNIEVTRTSTNHGNFISGGVAFSETWRLRVKATAKVGVYRLEASFCSGTTSSCKITNTPALEIRVVPIDLKVEQIDVAQVVFNPDINEPPDGRVDLVLGKPTVVLAKIIAANQVPTDTPDTRVVTIQAKLADEVVATTTLRINEIPLGGKTVALYFTPTSAGDTELTVTVDPANLFVELNDQETDNSKRIPITIRNISKELVVAYLPVACFGSLPQYEETVNLSNKFVIASLPIAPTKLIPLPFFDSIPCGQQLGDEGFLVDENTLWIVGKILSGGTAHRVIGIVDRTWFTRRGVPTYYGVARTCTSKQAFALDGTWNAVVHELLHTLTIGHDPTNQLQCKLGSDDPRNDGFWVDLGIPVSGVLSLMSQIVPLATLPSFPAPNSWIARDDYEYVFRYLLERPQTDPAILLVSGILHKDGQAELAPFYRLPSGIIDDAQPGDFSIRVLNTARQVLHETLFGVVFRLEAHPPVDTDRASFGFAVPYPTEAVAVQIQQNGRTVVEVNITTKLLRDAVASIPDAGFTQNPAQRRNALFNKIDALDHQLSAGALAGARDKLRNDIRVNLLDWLVNGYSTQSPLQYTKDAIIALVDELLQRLGG